LTLPFSFLTGGGEVEPEIRKPPKIAAPSVVLPGRHPDRADKAGK
jgi:hypothetical protein